MASSRNNDLLFEASDSSREDPRRLLVQRILTSQCFAKSARMREFLAYVCGRALNDPQTAIREQDIGHAVFDRSQNYDTDQDNIVRVNASQLRKKLGAYFTTEGHQESLILTLPKGHYTPMFDARPELHLQQVNTSGADRPDSRPRWLVFSLACLVAALGILCLTLTALLARQAPVQRSAEALPIRLLWSRLFQSGQRTDIVLTDSSFGLTQDVMGRAVPLSEYVHPNIWLQAPDFASGPDAQRATRFAARRRYTDMGSVNAAYCILALAGGPGQGGGKLCFARDFSLEHMKSDNAILLGSRRTNPWVEMVENRMTFHFGFNMSTRQAYFGNRTPLNGELPIYANDPWTSYCQVTFMPNLGGTGNLIVIAGTDPEGTETGAEFLTTEAGIAKLRQRLLGDSTGRLPYFEMILKSARIGGATPVCEIAAVRSEKSN
jgi:hypothetical protein